MWPKRADEVLNGGSLYWVFKGMVLARQRILRLDARQGADGVLRCALVLDPAVIRTEPQPRRPFPLSATMFEPRRPPPKRRCSRPPPPPRHWSHR